MKKSKKRFVAGLAVALAIVGAAVAGHVYDRTLVTLGTTTGEAVWTNSVSYYALELKRIWVENNQAAAGTVTVQRITSGGVYTQAVGSVVCTSGDGSTASFTAAHLKPGDMLSFDNSTDTNATVMIEYYAQRH
jgi:hypothetical protein